MAGEERTAAIDQLQRRFSEAMVRRAALVAEAEHFASRIGEVRERLGNPYFYSGPTYNRPENADESIARFTGYKSHEPGLRLMRRIKDADLELHTLRQQLRELGVRVE